MATFVVTLIGCARKQTGTPWRSTLPRACKGSCLPTARRFTMAAGSTPVPASRGSRSNASRTGPGKRWRTQRVPRHDVHRRGRPAGWPSVYSEFTAECTRNRLQDHRPAGVRRQLRTGILLLRGTAGVREMTSAVAAYDPSSALQHRSGQKINNLADWHHENQQWQAGQARDDCQLDDHGRSNGTIFIPRM